MKKIIYSHLRYHDDARLVRKNDVVRRRPVGGGDRARLLRHAALGVFDGHLEVVVAAGVQAPLQHHVRLAHRIVLGAGQRVDAHRRLGGRLAGQLELQRIVELVVGGAQPIDDGADGRIGRHQDEAHARGRIELGIGGADAEQQQDDRDQDGQRPGGRPSRCTAKGQNGRVFSKVVDYIQLFIIIRFGCYYGVVSSEIIGTAAGKSTV